MRSNEFSMNLLLLLRVQGSQTHQSAGAGEPSLTGLTTRKSGFPRSTNSGYGGQSRAVLDVVSKGRSSSRRLTISCSSSQPCPDAPSKENPSRDGLPTRSMQEETTEKEMNLLRLPLSQEVSRALGDTHDLGNGDNLYVAVKDRRSYSAQHHCFYTGKPHVQLVGTFASCSVSSRRYADTSPTCPARALTWIRLQARQLLSFSGIESNTDFSCLS